MIGMQVGSTRKDRIGADSGGTDDALLEAQIGLQVAPPHCATPCNCKGIHHAKIRWNRSWNGFAARVQGTGKVRDRLCRVWIMLIINPELQFVLVVSKSQSCLVS
jgi:hypothetical protein